MGSWGTGVFENDDAQAVVEEVASVIRHELDGFRSSDRAGIEDVSAVLACVEMENLLVAAGILTPRSSSLAEEMRKRIESLVDAEGTFISSGRHAEIRRVLTEHEKLASS